MAASMIQITDGPRAGSTSAQAVARLLLALMGASLVFAAFGLWLAPGSDLPELTLMKLGLSLFMLIGGMCCLAASRRARR